MGTFDSGNSGAIKRLLDAQSTEHNAEFTLTICHGVLRTHTRLDESSFEFLLCLLKAFQRCRVEPFIESDGPSPMGG